MARMAFNWEQTLGTGGASLATAYDAAAAEELYRDHGHTLPPGAAVDPGDDRVVLPFDEV